jgi:hypothetical protein
MRFLKNFLMSIGAVAMAAALVNVCAPQAVHAAVTALVQVSNPATNPALTSRIDDPGRIPYALGELCPPAGNSCFVSFPAVPANHRLVIEYLVGTANFSSPPSFSRVTLTRGSPMAIFLTPLQSTTAAFTQPIRAYVNQNETFDVQWDSSSPWLATPIFIAIGYMLDCQAAPCAPIAGL